MKLLRIAMCAAAVGFASAGMDQLTLPVPASVLEPLALAHAEAHGIELEQTPPLFRTVSTGDIVRVPIDRNSPGLSDSCYDQLLIQQTNPINGEALDFILGEVTSRCIRLVTREALDTNQDALITTIACPVTDLIDNLNRVCSAIEGTVADFTITQDITRTDRPNFFVRLSQDYYQCIPFNTQGCSASDVEAVAVALASGLADDFFSRTQEFINNVDNNLNGAEPVVDVRYSVTGLVFDDPPLPEGQTRPPQQGPLAPQGIFGLAEAFLTSTRITGASSALSIAQPGALFVRSDDLNFPDVEVLSPVAQSAPELCKNMAASLNTDSAFRASRCVADCQERALPDAEFNIWCPTSGAVLIREGQRGLPPPGIAQPITNFNAAQTGFRFTGSPSREISISPVATQLPAQNQQPATLPGGNPILAPGVGLPIATLPVDPESDGSSSSLAPTAVTTAVCLVFAVVSRRFC